MNTPVPMPTARQAELYDRYMDYIRLEREGPPIKALKAAIALVKEEGLNPYHAVHLHKKLVTIPQTGLHHATECVRILRQLRETDNSEYIMTQWQEALQIMEESQKVEKIWSEKYSTMTLETKEAAVQKRYSDYFDNLEKDQPSPKSMETEEQDLSMFDPAVKKGRTADSGAEKEDKEEKELDDLYEYRWEDGLP